MHVCLYVGKSTLILTCNKIHETQTHEIVGASETEIIPWVMLPWNYPCKHDNSTESQPISKHFFPWNIVAIMRSIGSISKMRQIGHMDSELCPK